MTPIISPWVFYLMGVSTPVKVITGVIMATTGILWIIFFIMAKEEAIEYDEETNDYKKFSKIAKQILTTFLLITVLFIAIPTESTLTKMIVAQNVTYERVEMVGETVKDVYEDIISLVDGNNEDTEDIEE